MPFAAALAAPLAPLISSRKVWASSSTIRKNSNAQSQKLEMNALGNVREVFKKDTDFIKKGIGKGLQWANKTFGVPKFTKSFDDFIWLRQVEDPRASSEVSDAPSWPRPLYPGSSFFFFVGLLGIWFQLTS